MTKSLILFFTLLMLFSCGKNTDQKTADSVLSANIALSRGNCQSAIDVLEENGRVNNNSAYLKTLASAYACRAGYSTLTLFTTDIGKTATPAPFGGTTTFSTSALTIQSTLQNNTSYQDLQKAIDILLYAGGIPAGIEPTSAERRKYFSSAEAADIDSQLLYLVLVQIGRFGYFYADSSASGIKGSGPGSNTCFTSYLNAHVSIKAAISGSGGICTNVLSTAASHPQLAEGISATTRQTRLCQGVILLNNLFSLLPNVVASVFSKPADAAAAQAAITSLNNARTALVAADPTTGTVVTTLNQTNCEDTSLVPVGALEGYFGVLYEGTFQ